MVELFPALPMFVAALLASVVGRRLRTLVLLLGPVLGGLLLWQMPLGTEVSYRLMGMELTPVRVDRLSLLFGYLFHLAAFIAVVYSLHIKDRLQDVSALVYAGSAVGAVFAGDLITLFVFWELLAVSSVFLILARRTESSLSSALRYLIMQVGSGILLLLGGLVYANAESVNGFRFDHIGLDAPGGWLIFLAFGIKSAFPLVHGWLTDAYPEATPSGTIFLASFTTKVAIYALARGFAGTEVLIYIGAVMACFPVFYAVIENDLRRVLAYSLINQLGFMVVGIGIGTELALNGTFAHVFTHVLYKGLLMMSMGAVLHVTGEMRGSELGGLYKKMPRTAVLCIVGAASISAFPLFSGFVSKSIIFYEVLREGHQVVWLALLFAAAGVFHHAGIKIPFFAFFHHDSRFVGKAQEPPGNMLLAMAIAALFCIGVGCFPQFLYGLLPYPMDYSPYDVSHVLAQTQLLAFSALAFTWLKLSGIYPEELRSTNLDIDWLYRRYLNDRWHWLAGSVSRYYGLTLNKSCRLVNQLQGLLQMNTGVQMLSARFYTTGTMILLVVVMLGLTLILYHS